MKKIRAMMLAALLAAISISLVHAQPAPAPASGQMGSLYSAEVHKVIYPDPSVAPGEIQHALMAARREHKRVIVDFGGNWCPDCKVLDYYFHEAPNANLLARNFVLVDVNIGSYDKNLDLAQRFGVPLHKGVPALAVLNAHGRVLYSQKNGEFEDMRHMNPDSVTAFLTQWKPAR